MSWEERESTLEYKLLAYNEHISSCLGQWRCSYKDELARARLQFEVYNNIGDMLLMRNKKVFGDYFHIFNYKNARDYYRAALKICQEKGQKSELCRKIAEICRHLEDEDAWVEINWQMIHYLDDKYKCKACMDLARHVKDDDDLAAKILEKALRHAFDEDSPPKQKRKNALKICNELKSLYQGNWDEDGYERVRGIENSIKAQF